ncbi:RNA polymerase sigma-70 factor [Sphingobacterium siyangense subsp. cladoniae]
MAYTEIFERYSEILLRHSYRLLADKEEAHDVIQDIFLILWDKRDTIALRTSLSSYLYTAVRNRIFDLLSHKKIVVRYADSISRFMVEGYSITEDTVMERELAALIEKEIDALPEKMRVVFLLNKREGLSYMEISEHLGITDQTAKQQVYKALKILKPKIDSFLTLFPFL